MFDKFPRIYRTKYNPMLTTKDRIDKLVEETVEVCCAETSAEILDETIDALHCCVEILRAYDSETIEAAIIEHNAKNQKRGYYEPRTVE